MLVDDTDVCLSVNASLLMTVKFASGVCTTYGFSYLFVEIVVVVVCPFDGDVSLFSVVLLVSVCW